MGNRRYRPTVVCVCVFLFLCERYRYGRAIRYKYKKCAITDITVRPNGVELSMAPSSNIFASVASDLVKECETKTDIIVVLLHSGTLRWMSS